MKPREYFSAYQQQYLNELIELVSIPSISTMPDHLPDVRRAAEWVKAQMQAAGLTARLYETEGHPIVYGEWLEVAAGAPTVLIYGHYDVQPVDPISEWQSEPFTPAVRDGNLYGRGTSDDKGQFFAHLKAAHSILQADGRLPVNVKFVIEGEEEIGSTHLGAFIRDHRALLATDVVVVSDTQSRSLDLPAIVYSLRGMCYMELEISGPDHDLHSGSFGGVVHNPAQALCEIIAGLHNPDGSVAVPGFYDDVRALDDAERSELGRFPYTEEAFRHDTGAPASWGEQGYLLHERTGARPTLEVNGLISGWTGTGAKTVLPARALAKISCRLVADQDPARIYEIMKAHIAHITPPTVHSDLRLLHTGRSAFTDRRSPVMQAAIAAFEEGWGAAPVFWREGGSIPIVSDFQEVLGAPVVLMGFGLPDDGPHGPNEKFTLECFWRGIATSISFLHQMAR